jgi:hypothetical protein
MTDNKNREVEPATRDFTSIGKFIVTFSQIELILRVLLSKILKIKEEHFHAVIGPYDFSMLCTVTATIFQQEFPERKAEVEKVFKQCRALNDHRVRIAHGSWTYETGRFAARHLSRHSLKEAFYYQRPEELEQVNETAQQLMNDVLTLFATIFQRPPQGADMDAKQGGNV